MELTEIEKLLINLIGEAKTNAEIAEILKIKESSVGVYVYNLCRLLGAKNRIDLYNKFKK